VIGDKMKEEVPDTRVNLSEPDLHFLVNIYRTTALLSCVRRYVQRRSFSVRPPTEKPEKKSDGNEDGKSVGGDSQHDDSKEETETEDFKETQ